MPAPMTPSISLRRSREDHRQTAVVVTLGALMVLGLAALGGYVVANQQVPPPVGTFTSAQAGKQFYTGSILYMPDSGKTCHQLLFDNHTGIFKDNGIVDCASAAYHSPNEPPKQFSFARMRVISSGFAQH